MLELLDVAIHLVQIQRQICQSNKSATNTKKQQQQQQKRIN